MVFIEAFVFCGLICMLGQLVRELIPDVEPPKFFFIMAVVGAVLAVCGALGALEGHGAVGQGILITGLGQSIAESVRVLVAFGDPARLATTVVMLVVVVLVGIVTAKLLYRKIHR